MIAVILALMALPTLGEPITFQVTWDLPQSPVTCLALALVRPDGSAPDGGPDSIGTLGATVRADVSPADSLRLFLCNICSSRCTDTVAILGGDLAGTIQRLHFLRWPLAVELLPRWDSLSPGPCYDVIGRRVPCDTPGPLWRAR